MRFYSRQKGRITWQNPRIASTIYLLRDLVISFLPLIKLPKFLVKILYGVEPSFVFYVHPRRTEDIYVGFPILAFIRRILGKDLFLKLLPLLPPVVLGTIKTERGVHGLVLTSFVLPSDIMKRTKQSLKLAVRALFFASKICRQGTVFGLGGLWPMATRMGLTVDRFAKQKKIVVTNGHCGTLIALYLAVQRISQISKFPIEDIKVMILGVGKMGTNLVRVLYGRVASITMVDTNEKRLDILEQKLKTVITETNIFKYTNKNDIVTLRNHLEKNHGVICTTSNIRRILKPSDIPPNTILIDDSRPEAIPRDLLNHSIVLEGGLLKVKGIKQKYNFGIGIDDNVFGCLAESYLLAASKDKELVPFLGDVPLSNFERMLQISQELGISAGDFKCKDKTIPDGVLTRILSEKENLRHTIPFRRVCWLLRTEDISLDEEVTHG
jgi:predicted amino acid dehydrogenase